MEISAILKGGENLARLEQALPHAIEIGVGDMFQTMRLMLMDRTPVYLPRPKPKKAAKARKWPWHPAGYLKSQWRAKLERLGFKIWNPVWYAEIHEKGLYPPPKAIVRGRPGRTAYGEGGKVYSKQTAKAPTNQPGPIMKPVVEDETTIRAAMNLIINELERALGTT